MNNSGNSILLFSEEKELHKKTRRVCEFLKGLEKCQFCTKLLLPSVSKHHEKQCAARKKDGFQGYCVACKKNFRNARLLAKHGLQHCKEGMLVCIFCNNRKLHVPNEAVQSKILRRHIYKSHAFRVKDFPYKCKLCDKVCGDRSGVEQHLMLHQQNLIPLSKDCKDEEQRRFTKRTVGASSEEKEIIVSYCPACKGKEFSNSTLLERHLSLMHGTTLSPKDLKILTLKKRTSAKRYANKTSQGIPVNRDDLKPSTAAPVSKISIVSSIPVKRSLGVDNLISTCFTSPTKLYSRPFAFPVRKKATRVPSLNLIFKTDNNDNDDGTKKSSMCNLDEEPILVNSKARLADGTFVCLKCENYQINCEKEFYNHVKSTHVWSSDEIFNRCQNGGAQNSDFWCPECDMTFVSKSALTMHLRANHEFLTDIKYYLEQLGYEGAVPLLDNQCEICFLLFEDDHAYQKHFRIHGLAFLKLQQQRMGWLSSS